MKQIALNYHLTAKCNMRCAGCFAHFNVCNTERLTLANCQKVLKTIYEGVRHIPDRKLNFAGGEPTLIPFLDDLCQLARNFGFSTSLITNGSLLTERRIQKYAHLFDWIGISIDSLQPLTLERLGRTINNKPIPADSYLKYCRWIREAGVRLKINTMVNRLNCKEKLLPFIEMAAPSRWKVFQFLTISGENGHIANNLKISSQEYQCFLQNNRYEYMVPECDEDMKSSYLMIAPNGALFDNSEGKLAYSRPLWQVTWKEALNEIRFSYKKFRKRGGCYEWKLKR